MKLLRLSVITIYVAAAGLFMGHCTREKNPAPDHKKSFFISAAVVRDLVAANSGGRSGRRDDDRKVGNVESVDTYSNASGQEVFHVLNYADSAGFEVISADRRMKPVLAFSESGNFNLKTDNPGVQLWIDFVNAQFEGVQNNKEAHIDIQHLWQQFESGHFNGYTSSAPEWNQQTSCEYFQEHPVPPSVTIAHLTHNLSFWAQGQGYNIYCPDGKKLPNCDAFACNKAYTGCEPLAIAQVLRYYRKSVTIAGISYPSAMFNAMPQFISYPQSCAPSNPNFINIATLLRDVGKEVDAVYNTVVPAFGVPLSGSGCQTWSQPGKTDNFFSNHGFLSFDVEFFSNSSLIRSELLASRPVIVFGSNCNVCLANQHIWIIDGIKDLYNVMVDMNGYCYEAHDEYYQMNWGWHSVEDEAWFSYSNITGGGITYNSGNMRGYIIRP